MVILLAVLWAYAIIPPRDGSLKEVGLNKIITVKLFSLSITMKVQPYQFENSLASVVPAIIIYVFKMCYIWDVNGGNWSKVLNGNLEGFKDKPWNLMTIQK